MRVLNFLTTRPLSRRQRIAAAALAGALLVLTILLLWAQDKAGALLQDRLMQSARELNVGLGIRSISVKLLSLKPSVKILGLSIGTPDQELALQSTDLIVTAAWSNLLGGNAQISQLIVEKASLRLVVDDTGASNWTKLVELAMSIPTTEAQALPLEQLFVDNVIFTYKNQRLEHEGEFSLNGELDFGNIKHVSTLELSGDLNDYPFQTTIKLGGQHAYATDILVSGENTYEQMRQKLPHGVPIRMEAALARQEYILNARLRNLLPPFDGMGNLAISGFDPDVLLRDLKLLNTHVSEVSGGLDITVNDGSYSLENVNFSFGSSDFSGSLRLDTNEQPKTVDGQLHSERLSLDELLGTGARKLDVQPIQPPTVEATSERLLSSRPFAPVAWFSDLQGSITASFNTITRGAVQIDELTANGLFENDTASLEVSSEQFAGGSLRFNTEISASAQDNIGTRSSRVSLEMQNVQLLDLLSLSGISSSAGRGKLSGEGTFWLEGFSPSSFAASVDGGLFTIIEDGELDSLLVEMAGVDLMESISLVVKRDLQQTAIRCGFLDVQANSGLVEIKDFIIDTEDSFFLANGQVNLNDESVSVKFEPHPRDASFFAAPTALIVSGSLTSPSMRPGKSLYSRIAIASALAALAGPAAIVLPFIEVGRGGEPTGCQKLFSQ